MPRIRIINLSKNTVLAENAEPADNFFRRLIGLMGSPCLKAGEGLIIKPCNSIHTFFMRFPIDVLFVDKDNRVLKALSSLKPFRLTFIYFQASFAIELPSGTIQPTLTCKGNTLQIF